MNNKDLFINGLKQLNIDADETLFDKFEIYKDLLLEWNQKINLTAIEDEREIYIKHFIDSLSCFKTNYIKEGDFVIDVGTGAGFPSLPWKIYKESLNLSLLDSLNKRINFLKQVCLDLNLENVEFIHGRAEDFGQNENYREKYDIATARAVASLPVLLEYCVPFIKLGGYFICLKGPLADEELKESKKAMNTLGVEFIEKIQVNLPYTDINHNILVFKKFKNTPGKYPRKSGKPSKAPIK
ncbi:16S rRNA (guanine527-N7)-methyltransferase [Alkalithermobacter thermoalcaliphilus JW-YL-7 = DSM 7308]|uniref:Ribosomal RNA small subunit methyltransferase G n=1 Tax=Alkalithermobacter thermoalcaliphilus JW-YL-7 = DSM 7308 TaxID=1121328 RepID=A0A150FT19_CLOPD|nr:Ribosomal RNA small subunit methyltransferase G [[Clostridium] paradoxum JW-YL-7 = DSM 7308]SHL08740.1 16S rRNA (guanine527-N7)-methyltransferase [[Clostridium] paradoxum JW-YL-7 = DSM 7308]